MAGELADADGKGIEEEFHAAHGRQPVQQGRPHEHAAGKLHGNGEQEHHHVGDDEHGQARQVGGEELSLPAYRQRPHKVGGAIVIKVTAHRHGHDAACQQGKDDAHGHVTA